MKAGWIAAGLMATMSLAGWGQLHAQKRFVLTTRQVAQSLSSSGIRIEEDQVSLLANVVATDPNPALDILSVAPLDARSAADNPEARSRVKMVCHQPAACLPFYVIVRFPKEAVEHGAGASGASTATGSDLLKPKELITMRAGAHAMMVMDDGRSHIQVAVISLENGIAGHRIRVASPDHKQIYVAEFVGANLLKRSF
jgi:hypothetical protein